MGMELHVRACSARNLLDKQTFGKQDPYCKLQLRGKSFKTRVHDNGHKTPVWNEVFVFSVVDPQLDQLVIEVKDKNFTSSTLIGECRLPVSMFLSGSVVDQWYTLNNGSKRAGEVNLRVQFKGPGVQPAGAAPMASTEKVPKQATTQAYPYPQQPSYSAPQHCRCGRCCRCCHVGASSAAVLPAAAPAVLTASAASLRAASSAPIRTTARILPTASPAAGLRLPASSPSHCGLRCWASRDGCAGWVPVWPYHHHHGSPRGYGGGGYGGGGYGGGYGGGGSRGGGMSTGQMAMGVGAGVLGDSRALSSSTAFKSGPSRQSLEPMLEQPSPQRRRDYFVTDDYDEQVPRVKPQLQRKLPFQYHGDVFAQHGQYTDAGLYMSRLPASRKEKQPLSARVGVSYKLHPVKPKSNRKRQYAFAVEAMAANRALHATLLNDNVVPSVMALCRSKDVATLGACVATLGHLSCEPEGRAILLSHNALALLSALALSSAHTHEKLLLPNCVGTLANLTIEDGSESGFIKEKALDCLVKQRRTSALAERACTFAMFNLSCPQYAYPRVDDAVHALAEHGKDARDRETLSRAVYNLACTRMNHVKLVEPEAASILRLLISCQQSEAARLNGLAALWHLVESGACRRALVRTGDCVRVVVEELPRLGLAASDEYVVCALTTLICLTRETNARELMGNAGALDALAALGTGAKRRPAVLLLIYRLVAILLSAPENIRAVSESVVQFLLAFQHEHGDPTASASSTAKSRYVLFALASILSWNQPEDPDLSNLQHSIDLSTQSIPLELDELLDAPQLLEQIYRHVAYSEFPQDSAQVRLQMVILYNLSFRYPKADVARLAHERLSQVGANSKDRHILNLLGGSFFSLCMEYEVHRLLLAAAYAATDDKGGFLLQRLARDGDVEAQSMCLNTVCILFDGRSLSRDELLRLIDHIFPVVVEVCTGKDHGDKMVDDADRAALRAACAACLTRFASVAEYRLAMVECGLLDALAVLAGSDDDETLRLCVHTYALLSQDKAVGASLLRGGVIKALTLLAAAPEEVAAVMQRLCDDGLLWAFGMFTDAMEPRDYAILSDAFYPASAALLLQIGVLPRLVALIETEKQAEVCEIVVELLVLIFQNSSPENDAAAGAYAEPAMMRAITYLVHVAEQEELHRSDESSSGAASCAQSCAVLLHLLSLHELTRPALLVAHPPLGTALPALLLQAKGTTQTLLLRCLYNLTCDADLLPHIPLNVCVPALKTALTTQQETEAIPAETMKDEPEILALCAGILRNTSTSTDCHDVLSSETGTTLLCELFAVGGKVCRENVALATCNLLFGRVNSHHLLSRGVLPLVLSLCSPVLVSSSEAHAMCSAVLRKLAIAPGNSQLLLRGGTVRHLVLLMGGSSSMFVKMNCVATFCLLAQKPSVPPLLASQENMCVDLLSKLAQFANASDHREQHLSSLLYRVVEKEDANTASSVPQTTRSTKTGSEIWQNDRSFLLREQGGALPPTAIFSNLILSHSAAPVVPHTPRIISYPGYAIEVSPSASYIEMGTIEPMLPPVETLEDNEEEESDARLQTVDFKPPPMFPKLTAPFTPLPLMPPMGSGGILATKLSASKAVPPLPPRPIAAPKNQNMQRRAQTPAVDASVGTVKHLRAQGSLLYKRSTPQHLTLVSVKGDVKEIPYERVSEAFGIDNHPHILHALEEGEPVLRRRVLEALASVLKLPHELVVSMKHGVLELIEGGITVGTDEEEGSTPTKLTESEIELQELSARVLSVMAESPCGQAEILKGETVTRIKPVFAAMSNKRTCEYLYDSLLRLAASFAGARQLTSAGYLSVVLDHLKGHRLNDGLRIRALKLLKNLLNDGVVGTTFRALELGAVAQCVKRLHSPNFEVRVAACDAVVALGFTDKARKAVVEDGGVVPRLCALLTDPQWQVASASAGALMSLAAHDEVKRQIVANEGLAPVNQLLQTNKLPLQLHTTKLVAVVTALPEARRLLDVPATTLRLKTLTQDKNALLAKSAKVALAAVQWRA
ncbi:Armadillo-type fold [Phytophthora cactorum]|nr:Armadillo-type fold [Phytophthora cactorum]